MDGLNPQLNRIWFALAFLAGVTFARAQVAPPPAPPITSGSSFSTKTPQAPAAQLYSIGDRTNEEQYYLELINRARPNPAAEGVLLATTMDSNVLFAYSSFGFNLVLMQSQFALLPPAPPLSMNALLTTAARAHSQNMLQNNYQGHSGPDGSLTTRLQNSVVGANGEGGWATWMPRQRFSRASHRDAATGEGDKSSLALTPGAFSILLSP